MKWLGSTEASKWMVFMWAFVGLLCIVVSLVEWQVRFAVIGLVLLVVMVPSSWAMYRMDQELDRWMDDWKKNGP